MFQNMDHSCVEFLAKEVKLMTSIYDAKKLT